MKNKVLKKLFLITSLIGGISIITPMILTSCNQPSKNESNIETPFDPNNPSNPDNPTDPNKPTNPEEPNKPQKYNINIDQTSEYKDFISLSTNSAEKGTTITINWDSTRNQDAIPYFYYVDENNNKVNIKNKEFIMPEHNLTLFVIVKFKLIIEIDDNNSFITLNGIERVNGDYIEVSKNEMINYSITSSNKKFKSFEILESNNNLLESKDVAHGFFIFNWSKSLKLKINFSNIIVENIKKILIDVMKAFDVYDVFPKTFSKENLSMNNDSPEQQSYNGQIPLEISKLQVSGIGAQLNQFLEILWNISSIINKANTIYNLTGVIADLWQIAFEKDQNNKSSFESQTENGEVKFKLLWSNDEFNVMVKMSTANIYIHEDKKNNITTTRIQLSDANSLKIETTANKIKIGLKAIGSWRALLNFDLSNKNEKIVQVYNFLGKPSEDGEEQSKDLGLKTFSIVKITDSFVTAIGKKGNFLQPHNKNRNVELYNAKTGRYITSRVLEFNAKNDRWDTNWYLLNNLNGLSHIKVVSFGGSIKGSEIYLNNKSSKFMTDRKGGFFSRKYDIEEKIVSIYKKDSSTNEINKFDVKIPMFFIQNDEDNQKGYENLNSKNKGLNLSNNISTRYRSQMDSDYIRMQNEYTKFGENTNSETVNTFVGEQDPWFNS